MANILVHIELSDRVATPRSLAVLNVARAIASELGATVHALLPCENPPSYERDDTIATLSRHGADKVALVTGPSLVEPPLHATHGEAIAAACNQIKPRLVLFAGSPASDELAARLATQLGANYFPNARVEDGPAARPGRAEAGEPEPGTGGFQLVSEAFRRQYLARSPLRSAGRIVVATIIELAAPRTVAADDAEVVVIHAPSASTPHVRVRGRRPAPSAELACARIVVGGGNGLAPEAAAQLPRAATALGGAYAHSRSLATREQGEPDRQLGLDGLGTEAELYLALGISGSDRHLAGLAPRTAIVAINSDAKAPIFDRAAFAPCADAAQALGELLGELDGER